MTFVYTVDVEDWYQVENLRPSLPRDIWLNCESRIENAMHILLELCTIQKVKGTFFISGWIAHRHRQVVQAIAADGHEIACHGFNHDMLTGMSEAAIRHDIAAAQALLEDICGARVTGYRAPNFSITDPALDILADLGFEYDSSFFPFAHHDRYGRIDTSRLQRLGANIYQHKDNGLLEFALPMRRIGRVDLPWAGGGYFRLLPAAVYRGGVRAILARNETFVFYMHPWEIDPGQPYIKTVDAAARFRHYVGLRGAYRKLDQLLRQFGGTTRLTDLVSRVRRTMPATT